MVVSLKANKKRILAFLVLVVVVVGACVFLWGGGGKEEPPKDIPGGTAEERVSFLQGFGWEIDTEPAETREVMIPAEFNDVYTTYNVMQKAQGFDLKPYAGMVCTQYKYKINNYPDETEVYATLLVYGEKIIGGDVACSEAAGFMHGFAKDSAHYGETAAKDSGETSSTESSSAESAATESTASGVTSEGMVSSAASTEGEVSSMVESGTETATSQVESGVESTAGEPVDEGAFPTD